jgi:hypothetical protein
MIQYINALNAASPSHFPGTPAGMDGNHTFALCLLSVYPYSLRLQLAKISLSLS